MTTHAGADGVRRARRTTIRDVAQAAGVSIAVVSYAVNGRPGVSPATRDRVVRAAQELGWAPSLAARSVRGRTGDIGLVLQAEANSGAAALASLTVASSIQRSLAPLGYSLVVSMVDSAAAAVERYRQWWAEQRCDAFVVTDVLTDDHRVAALHRVRAPTVVVGPASAAMGMPSVWWDDADGARQVGAHLVELGHRQVGVITGPASVAATVRLVEGVTSTVSEVGGQVRHEATAGDPGASAAAARRLLAGESPQRGAPDAGQPARWQASALVVESGEMAAIALDAARRLGLRVPWDVSIVATSDSATCAVLTPSVTALAAVHHLLGDAAARSVVDLVTHGRAVTRSVVTGGLVLRGSVAPQRDSSAGQASHDA